MRGKKFDHEDMPVYRLALEAYGELVPLVTPLAWPARWVGDQSLRACGSIVLNTAEGAGEHSVAEKARFYRMALRSAAELSAALDLLLKHRPDLENEKKSLQARAAEIGRMLTALVLSTQRRR
jgi:four helix bundle protein